MAANLSGMFNQLNQSIQASPLAGPQGQKLMGIAGGGLGGAIGNAAGMLGADPKAADPYNFMGAQGKEFFGGRALSQMDTTSAQGKMEAAQMYQKMGRTAEALEMQKLAVEQKTAEASLQKEQKLREKLAASAQKNGMEAYSQRILSGATDLEEDSKTLTKLEGEERLLSKGLEGRKAVAKMYGVSPEQFKTQGMGNWTDEQFQDFTKGMDSDVKAYQSATGANEMLRTHSSGLVWKNGRWNEPSSLGLKPAVHMQKVHNVSNKMVEKLELQGVDNLIELHQAANDAQSNIDNIDRNIGLIDDMPTGAGANIELLARRIAGVLGDNPDQAVQNAEVYMADAAQRVAKEIKAFGSGTGLSDKDREFTEKMIGGNITLNAESMKEILRIRRQVAQGVIDNFETVKAKTAKRLGGDASVLDQFQVQAPLPPANPPEKRRTWDPTTGTFK